MDQTGLSGAYCLCERSQLMLITQKIVQTVVWVILTVRLGDLITLLIIAKGGQCKDAYTSENVEI